MNSICQLNNIEKRLGNTLVLGPVSLSLFSGEIVGIVGSNGAGKSTLLNVIAGVYAPTAGTINFHEGNKTIVGFVPQDIALYESMTGRQNLSFWADVYKVPRDIKKKRIDWMLDQLHLTDKAKCPVSSYSGGMKRRLNLGVSMLVMPQILLLDEPTVGTDDESASVIYEMMRRVKQMNGTVVFISHLHDEVNAICDRVIHLDHGKIIESITAC
ncbi:MAG: ABC transporter ATP-binding protein [Eubacteriales bacterium]|nr:ABC transporter ATP-binding protein [Eubacteriales bacterium]